jgi:hypothetical protein
MYTLVLTIMMVSNNVGMDTENILSEVKVGSFDTLEECANGIRDTVNVPWKAVDQSTDARVLDHHIDIVTACVKKEI